MKIDFEFETAYGKFVDALWFPDDQPLPTDVEIEGMKQDRLNNWIASVTYQPEVPAEEPVLPEGE
jgi:phage terminase large subunit-like protein